MSTVPQHGIRAAARHRCGCWPWSPATERKLITKGLSQSAMDFQLSFEWCPWNSFSCEMCCRKVWENRNRSGDSFQWTALNTGWIFQWWHLIAAGFCCGGPLHWARRERERDKWLRTCHRGNAKSVQLYSNLSLSLSWPPSFHLTLLSLTFQFPETCRGEKASSKRTVNF